MQHKGGLVSTAYVGGATRPFCTAMEVNHTTAIRTYEEGPIDGADKHIDDIPEDSRDGIRYEFDYNRGNPGYIKDLFIDNLTPEPNMAGGGAFSDNIAVYGYYGIVKQGEVAEYSDVNKNFDPTTNRFVYSDDNLFQSGSHDWKSDYGVTLPGYIIKAQNNSNQLLLSRDVHFYVEPRTAR